MGIRIAEALKAIKALGHSNSKGTWALEGHLGLGTLGHLGTHSSQVTWALETLGHSKGTWALGAQGTRALGYSKGTWALKRHSDTWALEALEALYLADSII